MPEVSVPVARYAPVPGPADQSPTTTLKPVTPRTEAAVSPQQEAAPEGAKNPNSVLRDTPELNPAGSDGQPREEADERPSLPSSTYGPDDLAT